MRKNLHKILFVSTIVVLTLLMVQTYTGLVHVKPLAGVTVETEKPKLTFKNYVDGTFQNDLEKYCREHCGFREWFIRLYNQYRWSCFRETDNTTVVRGKDNWLFEEVYVRDHYESSMYEYTSDTAEMREIIETEALRLWKVQELLKEHNIHIFVNITPSKDVIFPEYLPENVAYTRPIGLRAYDFYKKRFDELGIHYIDNVAIFKAIKDTVDYPLFYERGTHWSNIASVYVFDSILRYMEALGGRQLPHLEIGEKYQAKPRDPDKDLENLLNLVFPMKSSPYWYVDVDVKEDSTQVKPFMTVIGDSYHWNFIFNIPLLKIFQKVPYWFYNSTIYEDDEHQNTSDLDFEKELMRNDYIMLSYGSCSLYRLGSYFLPKALLYLCYDQSTIDTVADGIIQYFKSDPKAYSVMLEKAKVQNKSVDKVMYDDAVYMITMNPEQYFEELRGNRLPVSRNKDLKRMK